MSSAKRKRAYTQRIRADAAAATRQRIIDVTRECLASAPLENVGLPAIAERAGVARSTIYIAFGSREGLMLAVAEDLLRRGGFERIGQALRNPDAVAAMDASLREGVRMYEQEQAVGRAMLSLAAVDRDAASGAARLNRGRKEGMAALARRLAAQGALRPDVREADAADVLWVVTSFDTFLQLYSERGLSADETAARLIAMARRTLCT
jgi:AcrR family transcriptional regulator